MTAKKMVEITRATTVAGHGPAKPGDVVKCNHRDADYLIAIGKARARVITEAREESVEVEKTETKQPTRRGGSRRSKNKRGGGGE